MKTRIKINDQWTDVEDLTFKRLTDMAAEYRLEDGTVIRISHHMKAVHRIEGQTNELGQPVYSWSGDLTVNVIVPPERVRES